MRVDTRPGGCRRYGILLSSLLGHGAMDEEALFRDGTCSTYRTGSQLSCPKPLDTLSLDIRSEAVEAEFLFGTCTSLLEGTHGDVGPDLWCLILSDIF